MAAPASDRLFASPRARARARELGVDLTAAAASGAGRLTEKDVLAMAALCPDGATATAAPQPRRPADGPTPRLSPERYASSSEPARSSPSA